MTDSITSVARDMQVVWAAFKRIEAVLTQDLNPKGVFGDGCLTAVATESKDDDDFDVIRFTRLVCQMKTMIDTSPLKAE